MFFLYKRKHCRTGYGYKLAVVLTCFSGFLTPAPTAAVDSAEVFRARANFTSCNSKEGRPSPALIYYRLENDSETKPARLLSSTSSPQGNLTTVEFELPATFGKRKMFVSASCSTASGESVRSNEIPLNNCDSLAKSDRDQDGVLDLQEDVDCDNRFSFLDRSSADVVDSDGDGVSDKAELLIDHTEPNWPGSSPHPRPILGLADPTTRRSLANRISWDSSTALWHVLGEGNNGADTSRFTFGNPGDAPFIYSKLPASGSQQVGVGVVSRLDQGDLSWSFRTPGFDSQLLPKEDEIVFGKVGDILLPGTWHSTGNTTPGIARFEDGAWHFIIFNRSNQPTEHRIGQRGDIPFAQDLDNDGITDPCLHRPSNGLTIYRSSKDETIRESSLERSPLEELRGGDNQL